jgi:signal transduction histidine kinase
MRSPPGLRLWVLNIALFLVAGGTIYGLYTAWHRVLQVEANLTTSQIERFQMASEVRRELQNLNNSMMRYVLVRDPLEWAQFDLASSNLNQWIDSNDPSMNPKSPLSTVAEGRVFEELNRDYDDYLNSASAIHSNAQPALASQAQLTELDAFNSQADHMRDLVRQLSDAHRAAEADFLANATASLDSLRKILMLGVVLLLGLVATLGWVIYRDMIAPLRIKLVHSQTLLEKQEKLATLGTLAAGIAHEIRNPLTSLKARLYTLEKHLQTVPAARKDTEIIGSEISRLERIVQDVLSFARPSDPKLETMPADRLLREVQGLMASDLETRGVQLMLESGWDLFIRVDSGHLKQVIINLVRNAGEAIDGPGTITLRSRAARAPLGGRDSEAVILEVSDTGKGISAEAEKRLFDPFFSTKETGTGLGLPIAARIVEKHGGMLQYQTRPGHGTTFGVVLPRQMNDIPRSAKNEANESSQANQRNA